MNNNLYYVISGNHTICNTKKLLLCYIKNMNVIIIRALLTCPVLCEWSGVSGYVIGNFLQYFKIFFFCLDSPMVEGIQVLKCLLVPSKKKQ